jgi:putative FmdB family regulatory protein
MPFYEYQCSACSHQVEVLQKISDTPLLKCPDCGKSALKRLISAPVFRLKGGGWYETDFKSDNEQKRNIAGREEAETKAEDKGDAKADAKESKDAGKPGDAKPADAKSETAKSESKAESSPERKSAPRPVKTYSSASKPAATPGKPTPSKPKVSKPKGKAKAVPKKKAKRR